MAIGFYVARSTIINAPALLAEPVLLITSRRNFTEMELADCCGFITR
jgi:hypothetical protein